MPLRDYEVVPVDAENIEDGVRDKKLASLRAQGYRVVSSLGVQHKGKPCLALVLEPPLPGEDLPSPAVELTVPAFSTRDWVIFAMVFLVVVGQIVLFLR